MIHRGYESGVFINLLILFTFFYLKNIYIIFLSLSSFFYHLRWGFTLSLKSYHWINFFFWFLLNWNIHFYHFHYFHYFYHFHHFYHFQMTTELIAHKLQSLITVDLVSWRCSSKSFLKSFFLPSNSGFLVLNTRFDF